MLICSVLPSRELRQLAQGMSRLDPAHGAGARAHDDRVGDRPVLYIPNAAQERAGSYPGRRHEDVVAPHEVAGRQHATDFVARLGEPLALLVVAWPEPALHAAADTSEGAGGDDPLRRPPDAVEDVDARLGPRRGDRRCDIPVADQVDPRARLAQLADQVVV